MKFLYSAILAMATTALSSPLEEREVQVAHLTFHGGPASYELAVPADGTVVQTNSDISINLIDAPDYNAQAQCQFHTAEPVTLQGQISADGTQQIAVGPPQPILSVSCLGMCVPTNGVCYNQQGQNVGPCCSGFCAATRCRAWDVNA
ncbi:hypothetical protein MGN70_001323 [Eutypa lata]|uniref:SSCRP protein n=1 Tax=Eutypa lata (strain UCR-EL1) TaxID=1287681 RepID=M7TB53_EUTLA|nr:hypothetical protein UCREL1_9159 [Eutypa lata UCREL1]KAI1258274.1 hypothetical protein MGN70_001323 [Eutypa lata]